MKINKILIFSLSLSILAGCKKEPDTTPDDNSLNVPSTYSFSNVDYSGQTYRIDMVNEMVEYMETGNTSGTTVSAAALKNMFRNANNPFTNSSLNTCGKDLISKCFYLDTTMVFSYMDSLELCSMSTVAGSNGVAGVVVSSTDNTKQYLFNERGLEITQIIEKGMMGGVFYYQAMDYYLSDDGIGPMVDNSMMMMGQGTAMEHHWDEAFGYFGAPVDFPSNETGAQYWAGECIEVNPYLGTSNSIMTAFRTGRAAISAGDMSTKFTQRDIIRQKWELLVAGMCIHEMNEALAAFSDDAIRNHDLSEAVGFLRALKYNPVKIISNSEITQIENMLGSNFYNVTVQDVNNAKSALSAIYNLDSIKDNL